MYTYESRVLELTHALEDILECFIDSGDHWKIFGTAGELVQVGEDVEPAIEKAYAILYEDSADPDDPELNL